MPWYNLTFHKTWPVNGKTTNVKPFGIKDLQDMKPEADAVYYAVYETEGIEPKLIKIKCSWKWAY